MINQSVLWDLKKVRLRQESDAILFGYEQYNYSVCN